jgi:phospholipase C
MRKRPTLSYSEPAVCVVLACLLTITACGSGGGSMSGPGTAAPTVVVAANPTSIMQGSSSMLTVTASNATKVVISDNIDSNQYTLAAAGGTQAVTPASTAKYTVTATGPGGTATAHADISVTANPAAPTVTMAANPTTVLAGSSSTLTVTATNATQVVISNNVDSTTFTLGGAGGTQIVTPAVTTIYTATATGAGGSADAQSMITVTTSTAVPTVTMAANPTTILQGNPSTLTVTATNATKVVISNNVDSTTFTLGGTGGTQVVTPATTTTYTATATGAGGTATAQAVVTVTANAAAPTVTMVANPTTILQGNSSTLTVTATNATQIVITNDIDSTTFTLAGTGGTQIVTPATTTTYTATATGTGGTATAQAVVTVTANAVAPTVTTVANPTTIVQGDSSTLTVTATNATQVVITNNIDGTTFTLGATGGTQTVTPAVTTTYTATATGAGGTATAQAVVTVTAITLPTVTIVASPTSITQGSSSTLTATATNATQVVITNNIDSTTFTLGGTGGTETVTPAVTTTYTATATGAGGTVTAQAVLTVHPMGSANSVNHVIFMMQENRSFDTYFGMLNPYRVAKGWNVGDDGNTYNVDGIDDKLTTTNDDDEGVSFPLFHTVSSCLDDMTSAWLESYGDVSRYDFSPTRNILMDGFVHTAENFAKDGVGSGGEGSFTDLTGQRAMAYYADTSASATPELNYYYFMASQFAISDRWFSPVSSKSTPNRLATLTGGTTQGLVKDPFVNDSLPTLTTETIFQELDSASPAVSWRIYYSLTEGGCDETDGDCGNTNNPDLYPVTSFSDFTYAAKYLYNNPTQAACIPPTVDSLQAVGDATNAFCVDPVHIAPLSQLFTDMTNGGLASFSYIEPAFGHNDEHPGSGQSIFAGQAQTANILNQFMASAAWADSVFFLSYDEGGGPYDHVPPVPGHSNDYTVTANMGFLPLGSIPDISSIAVNPDAYWPCLADGPPDGGGNATATAHCDLQPTDPGAVSTDAPAVQGFAAQLGFRLPNVVVSPFTRKHYVSHVPMDHTAIIKFVESRFINPSAHLTNRDAAQPDLLDFFDFNNIPWATPPASSTIPVPPAVGSTCTPETM